MLYQSILIALVALACIGVVHPAFNDNLLQRIALSCIGLGSLAEAIGPGTNPRLLFTVGCFLYAMGVIFKMWQHSIKKGNDNVDD
jgi:hypothetical protein